MEWNRGKVIGRGASATVSLAATPSSGKLFAAKSAELSCSGLLQKEKCLISQLSSPYIVKCLGYDISYENNKSMYNLFMEYVPGGSLSDLIKDQGGSLDEALIRLYVHQILLGLDYLHSNGLVHCDIKGQNILIGKDGVKIADFGCAKFERAGDAARTTFSGTPVFMAPEVARAEAQSFPADIWALGCTIIEMAGCVPWPEVNNPVSALYRIGYSEDLPEFPWWLSSDAKELLSKCFMRNAEERWTAKQLLQHRFFDGLKVNLKGANEAERNSPTSILDQDIWDSFDVSEASPKSTHSVFHDQDNWLNFAKPFHRSALNSLADRIGRLMGDGLSSSPSNLPNWVDEEGWISVRGIALQEPRAFSTVDDDELEHSIAVENYSFDYFTDEISVVTSPDTGADLVMSCDSVEHVLVTSTIDFESKLMENVNCSFQNCLETLSTLLLLSLVFIIWSHTSCHLHSLWLLLAHLKSSHGQWKLRFKMIGFLLWRGFGKTFAKSNANICEHKRLFRCEGQEVQLFFSNKPLALPNQSVNHFLGVKGQRSFFFFLSF